LAPRPIARFPDMVLSWITQETPILLRAPPLDFDARCALPGMRMGVRALPADVGSPWLRETVH
jgi:hypothetical protein